MVKFGTGERRTRSGPGPGVNDQSRRRTSKPPPAGAVAPAAIWIVLPVTDVTAREFRFARGAVISGSCGSHASAGTADDV